MADDSFKQSGTVFLVGAGPGHPGLITRLGFDLLQRCDAVAYDALIPMELIASLPVRVEKHYVGKRSGKHSLPQSKINELLVTLAKRGLTVVRLKGGDPSIFGRCGEEIDYLTKAGIKVVTVPGVTAASAAAAMTGFSLTNRHAASWIFMATGHGAESASIPVPWDQVAALPGGTLVIYMGLAKLEQLVSQLLSSGLQPETPSMVVQAASTGLQMSVEAPLSRLAFECKRRGLIPPALVIIGEAVHSLTESARTESVGLKGKRVLVPCMPQKTNRLCEILRAEGAEPIPYPTVSRTQFEDREGWGRCLETMSDNALCLFTGDVEVDSFVDQLLARGLDLRSLSRLKIIAWGVSTNTALLRRGIRADAVVDPQDSSLLSSCLLKLDPDGSMPLLWPRNRSEEPALESQLLHSRAGVTSLTVCGQSTAEWESHWGHELISKPPDYIAFTESGEVAGFFELLGDDVARHLAGKCLIAALDDSIAEALRQRGLKVHVKANSGSLGELVGALIEYSKARVTETAISSVCGSA